MAIGPTRTYTNDGIPIWQNTPDLMQGGFKLVATGLTSGEVLQAGTPVYTSGTARTATVLKTAKAQASATNSATDYKLVKGHHFAVGDYLALTVGSKAYAITAIDTTNADYDLVSVGTTLGATVAAGDVFFKSSATGASAAALDVSPNGLLYAPVKVETNANCAIAWAGMIYARRVTHGIPSAVRTLLTNIFFSESY